MNLSLVMKTRGSSAIATHCPSACLKRADSGTTASASNARRSHPRMMVIVPPLIVIVVSPTRLRRAFPDVPLRHAGFPMRRRHALAVEEDGDLVSGTELAIGAAPFVDDA